MRFSEDAFDALKLGDSAEITRSLGDPSGAPTVLSVASEADSEGDAAHLVAQSAWLTALVLEVIDAQLPGPGARLKGYRLDFEGSSAFSEPVTARVTLCEKIAEPREIVLDCFCFGQAGQTLAKGRARVIAPTRKSRKQPVASSPSTHEEGARYRELITAAKKLPPIRTAVVHPCDEASLLGALEAGQEGLIVPILVGPEQKIRAAAEAAGCRLDGVELVSAPHSHAAAERAAALAREGRVEALMKGALHTDELMAAVLDTAMGLRTERRMSHVFAIDAPNYPKPLFISDAAINIYPDLETKRDIVQNAIDLARALMIDPPKVAILSAVETVTPKIPSTVDAAALCKMADRGQITGGILDGPLAFDNAVSREAARAKGIYSSVAGDADILIAPDLEAGNMLAKQLVYLADAGIAGLVLGARVPIMLTSRADGVLSRLASAALAQIFAHWRSRGGWRKIEKKAEAQ
ncbi:bifunctional enoyl-CoA hydratase/phosphate acetyltransferase [Methylocystis bryophila]|uniref:Enoyl-CoA hydratase n=1 Tax=Methylocystis bryophila TaxID=655015 RepID=A0A1W6MSI6_9HYPH|nr:bifunctional enoyl-CoA hydratase/phosphate acetyltransferase [Methylocystis bryophila]ARN80558.1 enoyl-CoA hydratase [Methylocystis bryophila]BDV40609.1 phosphate acetyltransferase [Methylocystis bryophila]